ncbi:MAG: hypothetical protein HY438_03060 [DPANN group archaeon]|nr:hypothetical protein [DPANN group archaeon]
MSHKCNSCEKEFDTYESMKQHAEAAHSSGQPATQSSQPRAAIKIPWYVPVLIVIIIAIAAFVILRPSAPQQTTTGPSVPIGEQADYWTAPFPFGNDPRLHWHAYPSFKICGEDKTMLQVMAMAGVRFGPSGMVGPETLHVHEGEPWFHIESPPPTRKSITLANAFKGLNIKFSNNGILKYQGTSGCNDNKTNSLKVSVGSEQVEDPENLVLQGGQKILIDYS